MRLTLAMAAGLVVFWLALSGHYTPLLLVAGALSVAGVVWLVHRMEIVDQETVPLAVALRLPRYLPRLGADILRSALLVTQRVWSPRPGLRPAVEVTPTPGVPELSQVIYANSITLTPGTLSLSVDDAGVEVHALTGSDLSELHTGGMLRRVRRLEAG